MIGFSFYKVDAIFVIEINKIGQFDLHSWEGIRKTVRLWIIKTLAYVLVYVQLQY